MKSHVEPPADPRKFTCCLVLNYIESDGTDQASTLFSHTIELATAIDSNGVMTLSGKATPHTHPAYVLPIDQHPYYISLSIICRNRHKLFRGQVFWRRFLSPKQLKDLLSNPSESPGVKHCSVAGDVQKLPHAPEFPVDLTLVFEKPKGHHIDGVHAKFPLAVYFDFYDRMTQ